MKTIERPFRVKEQDIRGVALQVFILAVISIYTLSIIPILVLIVDFFIRSILTPKYSLLAIISKRVIGRVIKFRNRIVVFKPKRFAAGIGLFMSLAALFFILTGYIQIAIITLAILSLFSFLEAFFKFCAGCKIFGLLIKLKIIKEEECIDCVFQSGDGI